MFGTEVEDYFHFTQTFHVRNHQMSNMMQDMQQRLTAFESTTKQHFKSIHATTQQITTSITNKAVTAFKNNIDNIIHERSNYLEMEMMNSSMLCYRKFMMHQMTLMLHWVKRSNQK
jgi:hypothetical protein